MLFKTQASFSLGQSMTSRIANYVIIVAAAATGISLIDSASFISFGQDPIYWGFLLPSLILSALILWNGGMAWAETQITMSIPNICLERFFINNHVSFFRSESDGSRHPEFKCQFLLFFTFMNYWR